MHNAQCKLNIAYCPMHSAHCKVQIEHCTLPIAQGTGHNAQCTLQNLKYSLDAACYEAKCYENLKYTHSGPSVYSWPFTQISVEEVPGPHVWWDLGEKVWTLLELASSSTHGARHGLQVPQLSVTDFFFFFGANFSFSPRVCTIKHHVSRDLLPKKVGIIYGR